MRLTVCVWMCVVALAGAGVAVAEAQTPPPQQAATTEDKNARDYDVVLAEPDFTLGVLPTTLRLPKGKMAFRVTHRFTYKLNDGSFGKFLENGLGIDASAVTGLEFRFGVVPGGQFVFHRTGSKDIQFLYQQQLTAQRDNGKLSVDAVAAVEGTNNFRDEYSFAVGAVVGHHLGDRGAVYVEPMVLRNVLPHLRNSDEHSVVVGLGARFRLGARSYVVGEFVPRVSGYDGGTSLVSIGLERRVGGHLFQLNVSNGFDTTLALLGRAGPAPSHWHLGFNMSRKFF